MAPSSKGKEKVIESGSGKRKRGFNHDDKTGGGKRRNREILQFFEDEAGEDEEDYSDDSLFDDDIQEDEFDTGVNFQKGPSRAPFLSTVKQEEPTEEELDELQQLLHERYKPGSSFVTFEEDNYESKKPIHSDECRPSVKEPIVWKVKCMVGRERHSAFCLMQKYVDLNYIGNKLKIISAFSVDHVKGFIYIEADKQQDVYEACNGLSNIYSSRVAPVSKDDVAHLFMIRSMGTNISEGTWARVKNGKYKGDLAQVAAVNNARKKVTVKLVPRIDLQALAEKIGRGTTANRALTPAPRLISSSELEEFRPLIQIRRDRDTNTIFEVLDGMMLKDGYLYKKVSPDSLSFWGVTPTDDELLKFEPSKNDECKDLEWLSQLYGEQKKKRPIISDKGGGKGDGSSSCSAANNFEVNDLVFFGRKDFGVVVGSEKDGIFKIIKPGPEGPVAVTLPGRDLKNALFDKKLFTALDQQEKKILINDTVKVVEGPLKEREGTVKRIYRGIVFLYNETVEENSGYFCIKSQMCEKVERAVEAPIDKDGEPGPSCFGDFPSSPKSPLSPNQSGQGRDGIRNFKREDDAMFSIGQLLRIRVGPLKGYLCRVLAIRRYDVTVKVDSKHKVLTVKCEHLVEVRAKSSGISFGEDSSLGKPFELLGAQDGSTDWIDGSSKTAEGGSWNAQGFSTERSSWPTFPASNSSLQPESESSVPFQAVDGEANNGSSWEIKATSSQGTSWGTAAAVCDTSFKSGQVDGWGNQDDCSEKVDLGTDFGCASGSWGARSVGDVSAKNDSSGSKSAWNASGGASAKPMGGWGNTGGGSDAPETTPWNKATTADEGQTDGWISRKRDGEASAWNKNAGVTGGSSSWNKQDVEPSSGKQDGGSSWGKPGGGSSSWSKQGTGSSWSKDNVATENTDEDDQSGSSLGRSKPFNGARSFGGRGGRGVGQGGRGQFGRGRSFGQGGTSSWTKGGQDDDTSRAGTFEGNNTDWKKNLSFSHDKAQGSWDKPNNPTMDGSKWANSLKSDGGRDSEWDAKSAGRQSDGWSKDHSGHKDSAGYESKPSDGAWTSGWNKKSVSIEQNRESKDQGDAWNKSGVSTGSQTSGWGKGASDSDREHSDWDNKFGAKTPGDIQSSGWNTVSSKKDVQLDNVGGWSKQTSDVGSSGWGQSKKSEVTDAVGGLSSSWGQRNKMDVEEDKMGAWNNKKTSDGGSFSGWGQSSKMDVEVGNVDAWNSRRTSDGGSSSGWGQSSKVDVEVDKVGAWNGKQTLDGGSSSGWGQSSKMDVEVDKAGAWDGKKTLDGGSSTGWGQSSKMNMEVDKAGAWNDKKTSDGGSSSGWGQSKWSGAADAGGNENSWSSKNNWKSDNNFGGSAEQIDSLDDGGAGGNWRGGRGGRWRQERGGFRGRGGSERGGFRGRGGSDQSDFGGRGRSDWRGGFGGRGGSDRSDYGGRGRSDWRGSFGGRGGSDRDFGDRGGNDRGGFRGRGGFGGRGRGRRDDWNKNDSGEEKPHHSWNNTSNKDGNWTGNSSGGTWSSGVGDQGKWNSGDSGWTASEGAATGGNDSLGGQWNRGVGSSKDTQRNDAQSSGWNSEGSSWRDKNISSSENQDSGKNWSSTSQGWTAKTDGGNWHAKSGKNQWQGAVSAWNSKEPSKGEDIEKAGGWSSGQSKDIHKSDGNTGGWDSNESNWKMSNSSGVDTSSVWNQPAAGADAGRTADAWDKGGSSSWAQKNDDKGKGGW